MKHLKVRPWIFVLIMSSVAVIGAQRRSLPMVEWSYVGGDQGVTRYSTLADINTTNVSQLQLAWEWKSPDRPMPEFKTFPGGFNSTPLMIGNVVYVSTNYNRVAALDAETGAEKWV
ncbi:MAG: hypothetical protein Q7R41_12040, partial [Phycisphaerales bacterium]|nr:hypothetical protein [Phycisphaerales bacterium]